MIKYKIIYLNFLSFILLFLTDLIFKFYIKISELLANILSGIIKLIKRKNIFIKNI